MYLKSFKTTCCQRSKWLHRNSRRNERKNHRCICVCVIKRVSFECNRILFEYHFGWSEQAQAVVNHVVQQQHSIVKHRRIELRPDETGLLHSFDDIFTKSSSKLFYQPKSYKWMKKKCERILDHICPYRSTTIDDRRRDLTRKLARRGKQRYDATHQLAVRIFRFYEQKETKMSCEHIIKRVSHLREVCMWTLHRQQVSDTALRDLLFIINDHQQTTNKKTKSYNTWTTNNSNRLSPFTDQWGERQAPKRRSTAPRRCRRRSAADADRVRCSCDTAPPRLLAPRSSNNDGRRTLNNCFRGVNVCTWWFLQFCETEVEIDKQSHRKRIRKRTFNSIE